MSSRTHWKIGTKQSMHQILSAESAATRHEYQVVAVRLRNGQRRTDVRHVFVAEYRAPRFPPPHFRISGTFLLRRVAGRLVTGETRACARYKPLGHDRETRKSHHPATIDRLLLLSIGRSPFSTIPHDSIAAPLTCLPGQGCLSPSAPQFCSC